METNCFNVGIATKYGIKIALVLHYFHFWYQQNEVYKTNYYDGKYWVRKSIEQWKSFFNYYSEPQLRRILKRMIALGLLEAIELNSRISDRTKSYTLTEKSKEELRFWGYDL